MMSTVADDKPLTGTWKNGQVVLDAPANWPEGCKLQVVPIRQPTGLAGIPDDQWPRDPQGIAELLKRMDQTEPFEMTPEEEADWQAARQAVKDRSISRMSASFLEEES
jgi:hypothetical protein